MFHQIIPFTAPRDFTTVQNLTAIEHSTYNLSLYYPFPGFSDIGNFQFVSTTINVTLGAYGIPIACIILTNKGLRQVRKNQFMSDSTKEIAIKFIYGLFVQSILPVVSYIPMVTSYLYSQYTGEEVLISGLFPSSYFSECLIFQST